MSNFYADVLLVKEGLQIRCEMEERPVRGLPLEIVNGDPIRHVQVEALNRIIYYYNVLQISADF